jgi:hypothetical protein
LNSAVWNFFDGHLFAQLSGAVHWALGNTDQRTFASWDSLRNKKVIQMQNDDGTTHNQLSVAGLIGGFETASTKS